ncbi:RagB/SusD family nutrient uptake outer membrane protein [Pseudochryseolinea flava]|uniref:RagB/SusD family nutrient uptake outer membrane protein n=1 Tax=Pseudochryseolinea flava TaxID=2059302 RepID=A0A364Y2I7_9BACT|nr:RagB/SusD family nutrient uptake outer membrane protein [Pseudochryseolinea flava]RAW00990.1 RagB/SusD family nutrient uptake outer membrane protein [Pseudochryseolinea flava]
MKKIFLLLIAILPLSCKDFLEEEVVATLTQDYYKTEEGIEALTNGGYESLRFHHNYEWAYALTNYGTDEFTNGGGTDFVIWNTYVAALDPTNGTILAPFFSQMYAQINTANLGIRMVPTVIPAGEKQNTRLGEMYFFRGFSYFNLVMQFGGVPIKLDPDPQTEYTRSSAEEVFQLAISDLRRALDLLPTSVTQNGRLTKYAVQHFLAKAYLTRASELNAAFSKATDLDSATYFADEVILNSTRKLAVDYNDLFRYTAVNGPNEQNAEIILASQFDNTQSQLGRYGNQTHLYFLSIYQNQPGMIRDILNGREFQRLRPTDYALDIYDRANDSRFYKSFKTAYIANNPASLPKWDATNAPTPGQVGQFKFNIGDTSLIYIVNALDDDRFDEAFIKKQAATTMVRTFEGGNGVTTSSFGLSIFPSLSKYIDPFRQSVADQKGTRDGILARLGETYLIAAEAYGRKGEYAKALEYLNALRTRAAYKANEVRSNIYYIAEDLPYGETTSTEASMQATENFFTPGSPETDSEMYPPSATTKESMFIHFMLNERSRELMGELHRWMDLSRTKTLVERAQLFNAEAKPNITEKHNLRPIPQVYFDTNLKNGLPLTPEEKQAEQNPGW